MNIRHRHNAGRRVSRKEAGPTRKQASIDEIMTGINQEIFDCIIYSRTQITPKIDEFIRQQSAKFGHIKRIKKGSAIKFFDLMSGKANVYLRLWPTMEWDIAAGHAIFNSVGGEILDFTTFKPLSYNKRNLENPHFIAKPKGLKLI